MAIRSPLSAVGLLLLNINVRQGQDEEKEAQCYCPVEPPRCGVAGENIDDGCCDGCAGVVRTRSFLDSTRTSHRAHLLQSCAVYGECSDGTPIITAKKQLTSFFKSIRESTA